MTMKSVRSLRVETLESRKLMAADLPDVCRPVESNRPVFESDLTVSAEVAPFIGLDGTDA